MALNESTRYRSRFEAVAGSQETPRERAIRAILKGMAEKAKKPPARIDILDASASADIKILCVR